MAATETIVATMKPRLSQRQRVEQQHRDVEAHARQICGRSAACAAASRGARSAIAMPAALNAIIPTAVMNGNSPSPGERPRHRPRLIAT